ncbi:hypothetical protein [Alienimonas chondri]|uniref:Uncharacterized protein n=1 Tax=Alienimonas chondri TaxID=2681879 RepID=A0ABX1VA51_9PLAN|nr:hypothetical protein [Alienimonas chondri]NNJ24929.1 hypothetical protein [Alienimonas chondri]
MPYWCNFEADEPPENPDRVIEGDPFLYHPTAGPDGPGRTATAFDPATLSRERPGDPGRVLDWLRGIDVHAARISFDGGNDEGFARFEAGLTSDGELSPETLIARLAAADAGQAIADDWATEGELWGPTEHAAVALEGFAEELAGRYLGHPGWGNGPFLLFGAFEADLATGRFTDLRDVDKPEEIWRSDLPPRFPPGYRPPPPRQRSPFVALLQRLFGREN